MNPIIETHQLTKKFKEHLVIKPTNFTLKKGEICALIGKNGAGKSTFFKMLSGQISPSSGDISLFEKTGNEQEKVKKRMSFMIETPAFSPDFTAHQNLEYYRIQRGVIEKERIPQVLQLVGLEKEKKKKFKDYSMGMKQRLGIALCLLSSPDCLILDEPINGLDAKGINEIRRLLVKLNEEKQITILISSHILMELQLIASRYVFIKDGEIVEDISKEELEEKSQKQILVKVQEPSIAAQVLETVYPTIQYKVLTENTLMIQSHVNQGGHINTLLIENGVHVLEFRIDTFSLEDYFLELVEGESYDELSKK